jgi:hypothetical protein
MKTLFQTWLLTALLYLQCSASLLAQSEVVNHFDLNIGLSWTDMLNAGVRYNFGQNAVGANFGSEHPRDAVWQIISSVSYYRHLWGHSKHTAIRPWYLKGTAHFYYTEYPITRPYSSNTQRAGVRLFLGRDFNISPRLAVSTATGPLLMFYQEGYENGRSKPHVLPGIDLMAFYRLKKL